VALLVGQGAEPGAAQVARQVRPAQQGPAEELRGHEFVVRKTREAAGPGLRLRQIARPRKWAGSRSESDPCITRGCIDADRRSGFGVVERRAVGAPGGRELGREIAGLEQAQAEGANAATIGVHVSTVPAHGLSSGSVSSSGNGSDDPRAGKAASFLLPFPHG
jgi:hypothetical protein